MKYLLLCRCVGSLASPPSRGAWIEMFVEIAVRKLIKVAPLAGGVD